MRTLSGNHKNHRARIINFNTQYYRSDFMVEGTKQKENLLKEFIEFIEEYKVMGLAIAFIMGIAATGLIKSLVDNVIMPTITPFIPGGAWKTFVLALGPFNWGIGAFVGELLNFAIIAAVVFIIAKKVMKEEKVTKK